MSGNLKENYKGKVLPVSFQFYYSIGLLTKESYMSSPLVVRLLPFLLGVWELPCIQQLYNPFFLFTMKAL